jgi:type I restriction enzyme S subunit
MSNYRIDTLFNFEKGTLQSSKCEEGKYNFITASAEWKTHKEYSYDCEALVFAAAASGSLGRTHYVNGKFIASDLCFIITPKDPKKFPIDLKFYHIIFNEFKNDIVKNTKAGTSKEAIGLSKFGSYELPYFEIEKQIEIKNQFVNSEEVKEELSTEFTHQQDLLKQLRQAFLREAMQGKLVEQEKKDGNAKVLLEKIKAEKAKSNKKEKPLPPIKEEEIPFAIPENWVWCRLGELAFHSEAGKSFKAEEVTASENEWAVIKTSAITSGFFIEDENKRLPNQKLQLEGIQIQKGDIIFCRASGSKGLAGKSCLIEITPKAKLTLSDKSIRFLFSEYVSKKFIQFYNSSFFAEAYYYGLGTGKSTSMNNITREQFNNLPIPLPPLAEQKRIVKKLEELMNLCEELKTTITENQTYTDMLLQVALKDALQPQEVETA